MQKSTFEGFVRRYALEGTCDQAHWYSDAEKQTLTAMAHTQEKTVILKVIMKNWQGVEAFKLAMPSATKVQRMLQPIGEDITVAVATVRDRIANFTIGDQDCEAVCSVADYDAFPETFDVDSDVDFEMVPKEWEVEMKLTEEFVGRLMKSITAMNETKEFVLMNNKKGGLDIILNYENINTNRIRLPVPTVEGKDKLESPLNFSSEVLRAIITANEVVHKPVKDDKDAPPVPPIFQVSDKKIATIEFSNELFRTKYLLFPPRELE